MTNPVAAYRINAGTASSEAFYAVACDPARSVAVEACAGAGKTWMLVARIVRALLAGTPAQEILAITFTKKAAGEMRERLQVELRRCACLPDPELSQLLQAWGFSAEQAESRLNDLRTLNDRVLAAGRTVQIRTFHSWFAALLRGAPLAVLEELRFPLSYELLEDDARATALVWPRLYQALIDTPIERQDFFDSVGDHGRHQTLKSLDNALKKRVEFAMADAAGVVAMSVQRFDEAFPELAGCALPADYVRQANAQTLLWDAARILGGASAKTFSAKGVELETALTGNNFSGVCAALLTQKNEDRAFGNKIDLIDRVREAQALVRRLLQAEQQQQAWVHHQRLSRLTRLLLQVYGDLKRERGWVDMNDLETAAQRLLADAELSGWMQQRMDARVNQLLIDEFQDTNPLQWQALYGWLSAYAGAGSGESPSVFLVGDPKQSIYRFRRAEPQVFKAAQAFVVEGLGGDLLSCDHTRRCAPEVVMAMNTVMQQAVDAGEYVDFRPHTTASAKTGQVSVLPAIQRDPKEAAEDTNQTVAWRDSLTTPRVAPEEEGYAEREAQQAARWLAAQVAAGAPPESFMVLARKRSRLGLMHAALQALGVPSEQPEKLELHELAPVQDVVALLDVLVSPQHNLSLARALKSPLFRWSDADLVALAEQVQASRLKGDPGSQSETRSQALGWWPVLDLMTSPDAPEVGKLPPHWLATSASLRTYRHWVNTLPPHDALSAIYEAGQVLSRFAKAALPEQRGSVIAALQDVLNQSLAQDGGRFLSAYNFVRALKAPGAKASAVHSGQAVRLLTVHGAKGLEAPTVLLLDTDSGAPKAESMGVLIDWPGEAPAPRRFVFLERESAPPVCSQDLLVSEQNARALEEINALYVALTRAERRLVVSSFEPHRRSERASWWERLHELGPSEVVEDAAASASQPEPAADEVFTLPGLPPLVASPKKVDELVEVAPAPSVGADDVRTRLGLAMHRMLQWHPTTQPFEWTELHVDAVAREFGLEPADALQAHSMAVRVINGEGAWAWDANQLASWGNEVDMVWEGAGMRLDRLVQCKKDGDWWVIDFKSHENPEQRPEFLAQIRQYGQAVAQAQPDSTVRLAFITALGHWREVNFL
jgi:ATP-dependent helicase/nuclease subunit A